MKRRDLLAAVGAAGLAGVAPAVQAQAYPSKPITVIVPFAAGGPTDALARVLCQKMGEILGQQLIVENIGGAGGTIGVNKVAKANNDGQTLLFTHMGTLAVNYRALQVAALRQPEGPRADRPGRHQPDGAGHQEGPAGQGLRRVHGLREGQPEEGAVRHGRHRRGLASRRPDAEQHDEGRCAGDPVQGHRPGAERSRLRPVRLHGRPGGERAGPDQRREHQGSRRLDAEALPQLPNVPTIDEAGLKGYEVTIWNAFFGPKGMSKDNIAKINDALVKTMADPGIVKRLTELAVDLPSKEEASPDALRTQLKASIDKWVPAVQAAGVKPE
jgi:hypothetical protein